MKKYGLRDKKTGEILSVWVSGDEDGGTEYHLDSYSNGMWLVDRPEQAEYVRNFSTEWYNAGYDTPRHEFKAEELEVAEIEMDIKTINVKLPKGIKQGSWYSWLSDIITREAEKKS